MGPLLVPWVLHRKTGPRIQLWKPDLDSSMSWTVGLPLFLVWNERFFFLKTWGCYDVPEKHGDFEKHVEHVESTFRWVWSSIRSTTMLKMWWHVTKKTLAFHTFCLCLWTLTLTLTKIPSLKCRSMKMGKLYGTLSCLTDLSTVIDGVRCWYGTNTQRTYTVRLTPFNTFTKTPNPAVVDMQSLPFASVQPSEIKFGPSSRYEVLKLLILCWFQCDQRVVTWYGVVKH